VQLLQQVQVLFLKYVLTEPNSWKLTEHKNKASASIFIKALVIFSFLIP